MLWYKKITAWENARRRKVLTEFCNDVVPYFDNSKSHWQVEERIENPKAQEARERLNRILHDVGNILMRAGVPTGVQYTPPPMIGGYIQNIDIILSLFDLDQYEISSKRVIDVVDRSLGVYEADWTAVRFRTFNPILVGWSPAHLVRAVSLLVSRRDRF